jgi:hypothetical protein
MNDRVEAEQLLTAYRRMIMPEAGDRARTWRRLEATSDGPTQTTSDARGRTWWIVATAIAAAMLVAALSWPNPEHTAVRGVDPAEQSVRDHASAPDASPTQAREILPPAELPALRVESVATPPSPAPVRPRVTAPDPLRAELDAIAAARAALERGDLDGALARVTTYRRRFPDGVLAIEARAIGAAARCRRGPLEDGRAQARAVLVDPGAAAYRDLLRVACDLQ